LDCSCPNVSLGIFLEFLWFSEYFRAFKQFIEFIWNCFHIKNNLKKNKQTLSNWVEPEGPTQVRASPAVVPCGAHLRPAQAHRLACPWRTRRRRRPFPPWRERPGVLGVRALFNCASCAPAPSYTARALPRRPRAVASRRPALRRHRAELSSQSLPPRFGAWEHDRS
jgi:hypothetical protein